MHSRLDWVNDWELRAHECGYNASKLAETLGVTVRLVEMFFQERFGAGPHDWMVSVRMTHAAGLLRTGMPLKSVSAKVRYKQLSHFSREFKGFFGMPPSRYVFAESRRRNVRNSRR
jgi:AraC-like DNA-binding protein